MEPHISRIYLFIWTAKAIRDVVNKNYADLENASQVFEIKNKLKKMRQGNLEVTEYYNELQTLWQELDMHYEPDLGDLEGNLKKQPLNGDKPETLQGQESEPIPSLDIEQAHDHTHHDALIIPFKREPRI
ncbi:hypothetical protein RJ639_010800 [Escallonia herrerae]|uniref:Retrotransposon gag domain-containing protein n=1 Tax=Escallonia herrerae TaxID=1293975 RepID=A0AA88VRA8_9ASTE|nr:hypothetical protein RJ639_010800 [Escallonia herrerae]